MDANGIVEAYRWQRSLGRSVERTPLRRFVHDAARPDVWEANFCDSVLAATDAEMDVVLADMERRFGHTRWRVVHTDPQTPALVSARLAHDGFEEDDAVIQMRLDGEVRAAPAETLTPVESEEDWGRLAALVRRNHEERADGGDLGLSEAVTDGLVAGYRAKRDHFRFRLAWFGDAPVGYGASAAAPGGVGMIEDLYVTPAHRGRGVASGMVARLAHRLRSEGCACVFLGARVGEPARRLYARLGFRPVLLTRTWIRQTG